MAEIDRYRPDDRRLIEGLYRRVFGSDMANANKHRIITRYTPKTNEVTVSVLPYTMLGGSSPMGRRKRFRVKIVGADGSRFEAGALAQDAVDEWRAFMGRLGV